MLRKQNNRRKRGTGLNHASLGEREGSGQELDHLPAMRELLFPPDGPTDQAVPYIKDALFMLGNQSMPVCQGVHDRWGLLEIWPQLWHGVRGWTHIEEGLFA